LLVVLFWGLSWYAVALQLGDIHPLVSIAWRFFTAGLVLLTWLKIKKSFIWPSKDLWIQMVFLALCLFSCNFLSFYFATGYVTSGLISVVFAAAVFMTVLNQWLWARIVPERRTLIGAFFGLIGIGFLFAPSIQSNLATGDSAAIIGLGLSILGTWFFSVGNLISASLSKRTHLPSTIAVSMLIGSVISAIAARVIGESLAISLEPRYLFSLAYLSIGASVIAFVAYLTLVAREGAAKAGYATVLFPIVALAVSTVMEGYQWSLVSAAGVILATTGAVIVFRKPT